MSKYKITPGARLNYIGSSTPLFFIESRNGKTIAECNTRQMAEKIVRGLNMVDLEEKKKREFRL